MLTTAANIHAWPTDVKDTCANVFGLALRTAQPTLKVAAHVLEIGCAEFDWLGPAQKAWPEMTFAGIDWRDTRKLQDRATRIQGDVLTATFPRESFDWIVSVSAIEHIGLGHYKQDPTAEYGDSIALANAYQWLTPGGWLYFDVPWNLSPGYQVVRTSHRIYDDEAVQSRLMQGLNWDVQWTGVTGLRGGALVTEPKRLKGGEAFYYRMFWVQKKG